MRQGFNLALLVNASATGARQYWPGGLGTFKVLGTFSGATVALQYLGPDNSTLMTAVSITAAGYTTFILPPGPIQATITGGPPSGVYANAELVADTVPAQITQTVENYGASTTAAGAINTAAINAALARGGLVTLNTPGTYTLGKSSTVSFNGNTYDLCLQIPSNTRLVLGSGVILKIASGLTNPVLIQNTNALGAGDSNISVEGGIWDGNKAGSTRSDGACMCSFMVWFSQVTNLSLTRMWLRNSITYHTFLSSLTTFRITDIRIFDDTPAINGDGIHLHGNCLDGIVRGISGNTGDDLVAMLTHDTAHSYTLPLDSGPIRDVIVDGITGDESAGCWHCIQMVDFAAYPMTNVTVRNVGGFYRDGGILIDGVAPVKQSILIDGVDCQPLVGATPAFAQISLRGGGDSITINNVNRYLQDGVEGNTKIAPINVATGSFVHVKVTNFSVSDLTAAGAAIGFFNVVSGATVSELSIVNFSAGCVVHSNAFVWNAGTIGTLKMSNGETVRVNQLMFLNGNISNGVLVSNYRGNNNQAQAFLTSGAFTLPVLSLVGVIMDGTQGGANGIIRIVGATGTVLIKMASCVFSNGANVNLSRAGSEIIRVQSIDTPVPSGILTQAVGDIFLDSSNSNNPYRCSTAPSTFTAL